MKLKNMFGAVLGLGLVALVVSGCGAKNDPVEAPEAVVEEASEVTKPAAAAEAAKSAPVVEAAKSAPAPEAAKPKDHPAH